MIISRHSSHELLNFSKLRASIYPVIEVSTKYRRYSDFEWEVIYKNRLLDKCLKLIAIDEDLASEIKSWQFYKHKALYWEENRLHLSYEFVNFLSNIGKYNVAYYQEIVRKTGEIIRNNLSDYVKRIGFYIERSALPPNQGCFSIGISLETTRYNLPSSLRSISNLGATMIQAWRSLSSKQYKRGMGNTTNKNYGNLSAYYGQGIESKNRQVKITDINKFYRYCEQKQLKRELMLLSESAQKQIKHQSYEYPKVSSHV